MHLNLSQPVLLVLLLAWLAKSQLSQSIPTPNLGLVFGPRFFDAQNFTRPKRQLFREDIPHHRPLSGNHYAIMHGFPHPGRWADGTRNPYKTTANLPPPHQAYFDALDGGRVGRYHTGFSSGVGSVGGSGGAGYFSGSGPSFNGNELSHGGGHGSGGGSDFGGFDGFGDDDDHHDDHHPAPLPLVHQEHYGPGEGGGKGGSHYGAPPHVNVQFHGNHPEPKPTYGHHHPPPEKPEQPKTIIHYHPIQYSQVLNIPETPPSNYGPQPVPPSPTSYGPPNHVSGPPIGIVEHGGFIPSKGIAYPPQENHVPKKPIVHLHHHHHHQESGGGGGGGGPYRFDPFKIFAHPNKHHQSIAEEVELPVKIPILAQFHTSKPIKLTKLKEPVHIIYRHPPQHQHNPSGSYGPHPHSRRPLFNFQFHNFNRRPKMPHHHQPQQNHPDWFFNS